MSPGGPGTRLDQANARLEERLAENTRAALEVGARVGVPNETGVREAEAAAAQNARFAADPIGFCKRTAVNLMISPPYTSAGGFDANQVYQDMYVDLVPWNPRERDPKQVIFTPMRQKGDRTGLIEGCYFPYLQLGSAAASSLVPLEISRRDPAHRFMFTGAVNGCSALLCEKKGDPSRLIVVHYPNSDGRAKGYPLLQGTAAGTILCDIHFGIYGTAEQPNAFVFFFYKDGTWMGVIQRLTWKIEGTRQSMSLRGGAGAVGVVAATVGGR